MSNPAGRSGPAISCATCAYSRAIPDVTAELECHRFPTEARNNMGQIDWPEVKATEWCGEHDDYDKPLLRVEIVSGGGL